MSETLTPEKIYDYVINKNMSKSEAIEFLGSLIESNEDEEIRVKFINLFEKLALNSFKAFKILENALLSDESPLVRAITTKIIFSCFQEIGLNPLRWIVKNETSSIVLKTIRELLKNYDNQNLEVLKIEFNDRLETIASYLGVVREEASFFMDFTTNINDSKKYRLNQLSEILEGDDAICALDKNRHVKSLSFSLQASLPESIGSLSRLKNLDLSYNKLKILPNSFSKLSKLKSLDLSWNDFVSLPTALCNLNSFKLIKLEANHNDINNIPEWLQKFKHLKHLDLSHNNILDIPDSINSLKSLEYLDLSENNIKEFPESIYSLTSLKTLRLSYNKIKRIPRSIGAFSSLKTLWLNNNDVQEIPEPIGSLTLLENLNLEKNSIRKLPNSISSLKSLIFLNLRNNKIKDAQKLTNYLKKVKVLYF